MSGLKNLHEACPLYKDCGYFKILVVVVRRHNFGGVSSQFRVFSLTISVDSADFPQTKFIGILTDTVSTYSESPEAPNLR